MEDKQKKMYACGPDTCSEMQRMAVAFAAQHLQTQIYEGGNDREKLEHNFSWLVTEPQFLFAHLVFRYKNKVFAVYVDLTTDEESRMPPEHVQRLVAAARENDLVPCLFRVRYGARLVEAPVYGFDPDHFEFRALEPGFGLVSAEDESAVDVLSLATDEPAEMSEWEKIDLALKIVNDYLRRDDRQMLSFCSIPGMHPQLWFRDKEGKNCWGNIYFVKYGESYSLEPEDWNCNTVDDPRLREYDGYMFMIRLSVQSYEDEEKAWNSGVREDPGLRIYRGTNFQYTVFGDHQFYSGC